MGYVINQLAIHILRSPPFHSTNEFRLMRELKSKLNPFGRQTLYEQTHTSSSMQYMYANIVQIIQNNGINDSGPKFICLPLFLIHLF